ncbi:MAG: nuclear transport factor 2 family protein [Gammaproteobacteria bacterium]|jgi:hypothetical protein|nr:nuclear transport factor 2 family protein [Gammaproteobacteria bacterium]
MSIETNKEVVRQAYAAVSRGDAEGLLDCMTDDISYTFFGKHRFARTFNGKPELVEKALVPISEALATPLNIEITNLIGEGDQVVMEALGRSDTNAGGTYNNIYCMVITLRDGKIAAVREYLDTELVSEVFGTLQESA